MAPHSSTLAWKIPWMEEPGRLQSMGSRRVGHDMVLGLLLAHWWGLVSEVSGCGFLGIQVLLMAYGWMGPDRSSWL